MWLEVNITSFYILFKDADPGSIHSRSGLWVGFCCCCCCILDVYGWIIGLGIVAYSYTDSSVMSVNVTAKKKGHLNRFEGFLIVFIWSEKSRCPVLVLPAAPFITGSTLAASRWIPLNGSTCVTVLDRCALWQLAALKISPGEGVLHV